MKLKRWITAVVEWAKLVWAKVLAVVVDVVPVFRRGVSFVVGIAIGVSLFLAGWISGRQYSVDQVSAVSTGFGGGLAATVDGWSGNKYTLDGEDGRCYRAGLTYRLKDGKHGATGLIGGHGKSVLNGVIDQVRSINHARHFHLTGEGSGSAAVRDNARPTTAAAWNTGRESWIAGIGSKQTPAKLCHAKLERDQQKDCYWLILTLNRLPRFRLRSDSERPHRLRLYHTNYNGDLQFINPTDSPVRGLHGLSVGDDTELAIQLKDNCYLAGVQSTVLKDDTGAQLRIQIVEMKGGSAEVNPNVSSWRSDELVVGDDGYQASSTAVSRHQIGSETQDSAQNSSFIVRRAKVHMSSEEQSALAMQQVDELLERNDLAGAIQKLYVMFGEFGARQDITTMLAALLLETGQVKEAESVLDQGLRRVPRDSTLNELKAKVLIRRGAYDLAREHLSQMVVLTDIRQAELGSLALLGMVDYQLGRFEESALIYHELTRREPSKAAWWLGLGMSLESFGRTKAAREAYTHGLDMDGVPLEVRNALLERMQHIGSKR